MPSPKQASNGTPKLWTPILLLSLLLLTVAYFILTFAGVEERGTCMSGSAAFEPTGRGVVISAGVRPCPEAEREREKSE